MIRYEELTIGDFVLVNGKIRRVEAITKRKIGYHITPTDSLHYARLCEVFPLEIRELNVVGSQGKLIINEGITIDFSGEPASVEKFFHTVKLSNGFGEQLILREWYLHLLQHIFRALNIDFEVKLEKSEEKL